MKKILYILSIALMGAVSCDKQFGTDTRIPAPALPEGTPVTLHFSLGGGLQTKGSMTEAPKLTPDSTMYLFVYNAVSGALLEAVPATLAASITQNTSWTATEEELHDSDLSATVGAGSAPRYLQFVADPPTYKVESGNESETGVGFKDNPIYLGDSESDVAAKLYTVGAPQKGWQDGKTAYWQRISLPNGITAYTYPGGKPFYGVEGTDWTYTPDGDDDPTNDTYKDGSGNDVNYGDYVNGDGRKIVDGTGYIISEQVANLIRHIPMIRNFAKIEVSQATDGNFVPSKAVLINTPKAGFIAPYSSASGFVSYYQYKNKLEDLPTDGTTGVKNTGYTAPVPNNEIITTCPTEEQCIDAEDGVISLYMYERGVPTSNPTQLLVYGSLNGSNKWLKIDITDEDGNYIPFFREFTYEMKIGAITGTNGYTSMSGAFKGPSIGNPSSSPETQTLTQVTDGKGVGIWVDYIDYASFDTSGETATLRYKFWNAEGVKTSTATLTVTHSTSTGAITTTTLTGEEYTGTKPTQDGQSGWYVVNVPLQPQGGTVMRSVLRVSGTTTNTAGKTVTLYRDVTFSVMPTQKFSAKLTTLPSDAIDQPTTLTITLEDGLGYALFPLVFRIEAKNGSINPTDADLPVESGTSTFTDISTSRFWYNKTISWKEYNDQGLRAFDANFKTIFASGNATTVRISDPDGHFIPVEVALSN